MDTDHCKGLNLFIWHGIEVVWNVFWVKPVCSHYKILVFTLSGSLNMRECGLESPLKSAWIWCVRTCRNPGDTWMTHTNKVTRNLPWHALVADPSKIKWTFISLLLFQSTDRSNCLTTLVTFNHSHAHSYSDGACIRSNSGFSILYQGYSDMQPG